MIDLLQNICDVLVWSYRATKDYLPFTMTLMLSAAAFFFEGLKYLVIVLNKVTWAMDIATTNLPATRSFLTDLLSNMNSFSSEYFPKINAYFPADFLFTCVSFYLGIVVIGVIVRSIKSFVPTVS